MNDDRLRSGQSLWRAIGTEPVACPTFEGTLRCEVAVIGSGITGVLVTSILSRAGVDTVLLDKGAVGLGSTAASTGLLQYEVDTPLIELIGKVGESKAVHAYRRGLQAIDEIQALTEELGDETGFDRRSTLCLASGEEDVAPLRLEFECRRAFGFDVSFWELRPLLDQFGLRAPAALHSLGDAAVDPYALTQALLRKSREDGLRAFERTEVTSLRESASRVILRTTTGEVEARAVIVATGYSAAPFLGRPFATLHTTYALAGVPAPGPRWPDRCLIWETARPYFYGRQSLGGMVVIGGEDTARPDDHQDPALLAHKARRLQDRFRELFPGSSVEADYVWAGTFGETEDGLPWIGRAPGGENVYFALGYGGNGITFSMIAARLLTDLFLGRPSPDAAVFGFDR